MMERRSTISPKRGSIPNARHPFPSIGSSNNLRINTNPEANGNGGSYIGGNGAIQGLNESGNISPYANDKPNGSNCGIFGPGNDLKRTVVRWIVIIAVLVIAVNAYLHRSTLGERLSSFRGDNTSDEDIITVPIAKSVEDFERTIPVDSSHLRQLLDDYKAEILYSAKNNLFHVGDKLYKFTEREDSEFSTITSKQISNNRMLGQQTTSTNYRFHLIEIDPCNAKTLLDVFDIAQNPIVNLNGLYPLTRPLSIQRLSVEPVSVDRSHTQTRSQVLIVYTTCNQLPTTIMSLQFLRNTDKLGDLLIIDDFSTDGTVEYLQKRGFAVISKPKATGLTDSWNIGYRIAVALGYKYVVFTNNDVLLTTGSVALMTRGLSQHALVVPLTTEKGAGHHPPQSITRAYNLLPALNNYIDDYRNAEFIQESILKKFIFVPPEQRRCPAELSKARGLPKFNGFCFSINVDRMNPAAFEPNVHLFDPADIIVGQEDHLVKRMHKNNLVPIILHCAFVYHFKSITVSSANITSFALELQQSHNISVQQIGNSNSPIAKLSYTDPKTGKLFEKEFDIREDLRWYHPEERENFLMELFNITTNGLSVSDGLTLPLPIGKAKALAGQEEEFEVHVNRGSIANSDMIGESSKDERFRNQLMNKCRSDTKEVLFPRHTMPMASRLEQLYKQFPSMNWNIRANPYCVYPSQWQPHCEQYLSTNSNRQLKFEPELYAKASSRYIVIAFAMSDPVKNPSAGDVFTAYELGAALVAQYSNVKVKYLRRDVNWYSPQALSEVDVLITLLDQYDLTKTLSMFQDSTPPSYTKTSQFQCLKKLQIKPSLVTIAWVRNWFHRWLTKPWIGNYDTILTTSALTKSFYDTINNELGLPVSCALSCPHKLAGYALKALPERFANKLIDPEAYFMDSMIPTNESWYLFPTRAKTSVYIYPIATAIDYGAKNVSSHDRIIRGSGNSYSGSSSSSSSNSMSGQQRRGAAGDVDITLISSPSLPSLQTIPKYDIGKDKNKQKMLLSSPVLLEAETKRLFHGVDYIFTGSYFNVPRKVMNFDPDEIPKWVGRIVGGNWDKVKKQVSKGWMAICLGLLPYEMVKESYKYVKIVVDDANHVTAPWGSVNSRVFDALASGAMVVSNGEIGMKELFGPALAQHGLKLPLYTDGKDLVKILDYYLKNDDIRLRTTRVMKEVVYNSHTYRRRAIQLADLLANKFSMILRKSDGSIAGSNKRRDKGSNRYKDSNEEDGSSSSVTNNMDRDINQDNHEQKMSSMEEAGDIGEDRRRVRRRLNDANELDVEEEAMTILQENDDLFNELHANKSPQYVQWDYVEESEDIDEGISRNDGRRLKVSAVPIMSTDAIEVHERAPPQTMPMSQQKVQALLTVSNTQDVSTVNVKPSVPVSVPVQSPVVSPVQAKVDTPAPTKKNRPKPTIAVTKVETEVSTTEPKQKIQPVPSVVASTSTIAAPTAAPTGINTTTAMPTTPVVASTPLVEGIPISTPKRTLQFNPKKLPVKNNVQYPQTVCIGVRTSKGQEEWIPVLMRSLIAQHVKSKYRQKLALQLFVVDTEANTDYTKFLIRQAEKFNTRFHFPYIQIVVPVQTTNPVDQGGSTTSSSSSSNGKPLGNKLYGYDDTDRLLELMLSMKECGNSGETATPTTPTSSVILNDTMKMNSFQIPSCEWVMFTNGDNMYNSAWLNTIGSYATAEESHEEPYVKIEKVKDSKTKEMKDVVISNTTRLVIDNAYDIIGWDFITHHPRGDKNDTPNQPIRISFERGYLDLGSVILRANLFTKINAKFLPEAAFTKDLFARDFHTISKLLPLTTPERIKLVHQYLLLHQ